MEQVLDEAETATGSTPETVDESPATAADAPSSHSSTDAADVGGDADRAPGASETASATVDKDAAAFARLEAGEAPKVIQQNPKPLAPSTGTAQAEVQEGSAEPKAPTPKPTNAQAADSAGAVAYEGLDAKALNTLRRAQLIVEPETWNAMGPRQRASLQTAAKKALQMNGRIGQQLGQARGQSSGQSTRQTQPAPEFSTDNGADIDIDDGTDTQAVDEGEPGEVDDPGTVTQPPRGATQPRRQQGVRAQTQPGQARPDAQPAELDEALKPAAEMLGEEGIKPFKDLFTRQQQELARVQQEMQALTDQNRWHQQQTENNARVEALQRAQVKFEALEKQFGSEIPPDMRDLIHEEAIARVGRAYQRGHAITWEQAIEDEAHAALHPDIKQQAQQKLLDSRAQSLSRTPTKAAPTRPHRASTPVDRDSLAYAKLEAGASREEARTALL